VQRYIRQILLHMSAIIGQHFELPVIQKMSGVPLMTQQQVQMVQQGAQVWQQYNQQVQQAQQMGQPPPPPPGVPQPDEDMIEQAQEPTWEMVMSLLKDEKLRGFVIDVETDSTIEADQMQQQQKAEQFLTAVTQYCAAWAQILPVAPDLADLAGEMLISAARLFKMGDTLETVIEEAVEKLEKKAEMPPPPNPQMQADQMKAQADVQTAQIGTQTAQIKAHAEEAKATLQIVDTVMQHHANQAQAAADIAVAQAQPLPSQVQPPEMPQ